MRINSIGAYYQEILSGWTFGSQTDQLTVLGDLQLEASATPGFEYTFPDKTGIIALRSDINYLTGATFDTSNGILSLGMFTGNTVNVDLDDRYLTISASTGLSDDYVSSASFDNTNGIITLTRISGGTVTVDIDGRYLLSSAYTDTNIFVSGATFDNTNGIITYTNTSGGTFNVDIDGRYLASSGFTASGLGSGDLSSGVVPYYTATGASSAYKVSFVRTTANASGNFEGLIDSTTNFTYNPSTNTLDSLNLGSSALPYATVSSTASAFKVPFLNTTGTANGNFGLLHDSAATFTYNPSSDTLTVSNINATNLGSTTRPYITASGASSAYKVVFANTTGNASGNFNLLHDNSTNFTYNPSTNTIASVTLASPVITTQATTTSTTFTLLDTVATTLNTFGAATSFTMGGTPTTTLTANYFANTTSNGNTKTLNFGTGGASGSITNINLGSATAGATGTATLHSTTINFNETPATDGSFSTSRILTRDTSGNVDVIAASGGGTANFLRADGTWAPAGGGGGSGDVVTGMTFTTTNGILELRTLSGTSITEDLDGRYAYITGNTANVALIYNNPSNTTSIVPLSGSNTSTATYSTVGGGSTNTNSGQYSTIGGGLSNNIAISRNYATIGGGRDNEINTAGSYGTIGGGQLNTNSASYSFIGGGRSNSTTSSGTYAVIGGGGGNSSAASVAVIGGGRDNTITASRLHATIGGGQANTISGGTHGFIGGGWLNVVTGNYSTIGGGRSNNNTILYSTIGGGYLNDITGGNAGTISGGYNNDITIGNYTTVGGGRQNSISANYGTIAGGYSNTIAVSRLYSTIGGGFSNDINTAGSYITIGGGRNNEARSDYSTISGGYNNSATAIRSFVGGGQANSATGNYSTIVGGFNNAASGAHAIIVAGDSNTNSANYTFIGGGSNNTIAASRTYGTIGGGYRNAISGATGSYMTIGGGINNTASAGYATVGGGNLNTVSGGHSFVGGGWLNISSGSRSFVGGGRGNSASAQYATVAGGRDNAASVNNSFIGGGKNNAVSGGDYGGILGGLDNTVSHNNSFIIGSGITSTAISTTYVNNFNINSTPATDAGFSTSSLLTRDTSGNVDRLAASGGGTTTFLRADGTWATPVGGSSTTGTTLMLTDAPSLGAPYYSEDFATDLGDFTTYGDSLWTRVTNEGNGDLFSAKSGAGLGSWGYSMLQIIVTATTEITACKFDYKTSTENHYDWLYVTVDGARLNRYSGTIAWTTQTFYFQGTGTHVIHFLYQHDPNTIAGSDAVWIDNFELYDVSSGTTLTVKGPTVLTDGLSVSGNTILQGNLGITEDLFISRQFGIFSNNPGSTPDGQGMLRIRMDGFGSGSVAYIMDGATTPRNTFYASNSGGSGSTGKESNITMYNASGTTGFKLSLANAVTYLQMPQSFAEVHLGRFYDASGYILNVDGTSIFYGDVKVNNAKVGINIDPIYDLHINSTSSGFTALLNQTGSTSTYNVMVFDHDNGSARGMLGVGGSAVSDPHFANAFGVGTQNAYPTYLVTNDSPRVKIDGSTGNVTLYSISAATTDTDKFLVSDGGVVKYRTGAQLASDIGAGGFTIVVKSSDESRTNNITLSADSALFFSAEASSSYIFEAKLFVNGDAVPDIKIGIYGPTSSTAQWSTAAWSSSGGATANINSTVTTSLTGAAQPKFVAFRGYLDTAGTAGDFGIRWAQNTSDANAITMMKWSTLEYYKVA